MDMTNTAPAAGMSDAEMAAGLAGLQAPPPVETPAPSAGGVRWLTDVKRVESYDLAFPFAIGDAEYRTIKVKRLSAGEVAAYVAKLRALPAEEPNPRFPMFYHGDVEIPDDAWHAMDDDDRVALTELSDAFLSARFRR